MSNTPIAPAGDPLAQLRDIHMPDPIGWWPLAPGWWVVIIFLLALLVYGIRTLRRRKLSELGGVTAIRTHLTRNRYRDEALKALDVCFEQHSNSSILSEQLLAILRRCALTVGLGESGESAITQSAGKLLTILDQHAGSPVFGDEIAVRLEELAYAPSPSPLTEEERSDLKQRATHWIKKHHRSDSHSAEAL